MFLNKFYKNARVLQNIKIILKLNYCIKIHDSLNKFYKNQRVFQDIKIILKLNYFYKNPRVLKYLL